MTVAFAGGIWIATSLGAVAVPINGSAIKNAAAEIGLTENVHCRPYRHPHRWGYGRGCARGGVVFDEGVRVRSRFGFRPRDEVRFRSGFRSRDNVGARFRSGNRDGVGVRSGGGLQEGATIHGGTERSGTTIRSRTSGSVESRGSISGGQAREGTTGGIRSGESGMRTAPTGQGMQGGAAGSAGGTAGTGSR